MLRRNFVKSLACLPLASAVLGAVGNFARAAWPSGAFKNKELDAAIADLFGTASYVEDDMVKLKAPEIAENGAVVPIEIGGDLATMAVAVFVEKNPQPLSFHMQLEKQAVLPVSSRIKMRESSNVLALVQTADGKLHASHKEVKVTIGGCGG